MTYKFVSVLYYCIANHQNIKASNTNDFGQKSALWAGFGRNGLPLPHLASAQQHP